ncbi:MAG: B12-binding domain-containing radical SAM protein [Spirochaetes bacterium]|nr:B12-binding domain-containing radical SAM protein [Spirochaetota bacterium]
MDIILIYPSGVDENGRQVKTRKAFFPPLSLAILNSLTPPRHSVTVINDIFEDIDFSRKYDLAGITCMALQSARAFEIAKRFRALGTKVVIGGFHASLMSDEVKEHCDSVVIGEAENLWEQIIEDCENDDLKPFYQDAGKHDLSRLVIPRWDNINLKNYAKWPTFKYPMMPIYTTRGCPMGCSFCTVSQLYGKSYRIKPVEHVIKEIESVRAEFYFFVDDNIAFNVEYSRQLFTELARLQKRRKFKWISQISTTVVNNPELIDLAGRAGCHSLFIGIETINSDNLRELHKNFNKIERYGELFRMIRKAGIGPIASMMLGMDHDTPDTFDQTLDFLKKNKIFNAFFFIFTPIPGSAVFDELKAQGRLLHRNMHLYDGAHVVFRPSNFTPEELTDGFWKLYNEFYSIKNILRRTYDTAVISSNPVRNIFENSLFYWFFRHAVRAYEHPLSGGLGRIM